MAVSISSWNVAANIEWWVVIDITAENKVMATFFTSKDDADGWTNIIAQGTSEDVAGVSTAVIVTKQYTDDTFEYRGYDYDLSFFDYRLAYHLRVTGDTIEGNNLFKVGPFYDLDEIEHTIYNNVSIARIKATQMINQASHIQKKYELELANLPNINLNQLVRVTSSVLKDSDFVGVVESFTITGDKDSVRATSLCVSLYEEMTV